MQRRPRSTSVRRQPPWPIVRMFGLGLLAVIAAIWAIVRSQTKQPPSTPAAPHTGEIEVEFEPIPAPPK